jgi:hypothetical protein
LVLVAINGKRTSIAQQKYQEISHFKKYKISLLSRDGYLFVNPNPMLRVVLLASGIGADPTTYRPGSDESQWWNRRDALVRCVAAFFFAHHDSFDRSHATLSDDAVQSAHHKELHIVFDQDWSTFRMSFLPNNTSEPRTTASSPRHPSTLLPTEQTIVALWKRSATTPGDCVEQDGLQCQLLVSECSDGTARNLDCAAGAGSTSFRNKRDLVQYLQSTCSIDFLREHKYVCAVVAR